MKAFNYKIGVKTCEDEIGINSDIMTEVDNQKRRIPHGTNTGFLIHWLTIPALMSSGLRTQSRPSGYITYCMHTDLDITYCIPLLESSGAALNMRHRHHPP